MFQDQTSTQEDSCWARQTYSVDLANRILWVLARFEKLLKDRLSTRRAIVEEHIECNESVDVPGSEDFLDLGSGIRLSFLPSFAFHTLLSEHDFLLGQVERLGNLGEIGEREVSENSNRQ